ncbi:hypothetical protein [Bacillus thuringiensis]|uniref:hypothetical protein n=1 Tax=Bacillus thuringiensis TaxID=1428 RepID=UPI0026E34B2A|nr:hypothetical protein [Bacillus thuringiensis]MDO6628676.1 hypothetical protein [Bacillus thuringiensis]MDO6659199.1 hypothetical protein [Bacillus thuringiensis]MDO6698781.1 hypothetical protein [Bacillus thuringiensis]
MTYSQWLNKNNMVSDEVLKERLLQDCFSLSSVKRRIKENHDMYEGYCQKNNTTPNYN